jgi:hypothetical protein
MPCPWSVDTECGRDLGVPFRSINLNLAGIVPSPRQAGLRHIQRKLVGAIGFEPTTPCAQGRCATRLRYAPT